MPPRKALAPLLLAAAAALPAAAGAQTSGIARAHMDTACAACADFYRYANGAWLKTAQIPAQYTAVGVSREVVDMNNAALRRVLEDAASRARTATDPGMRKVGAFYATCMDSAAIERAGISPLADEMRRIDAVRDLPGLSRQLARLHRIGVRGGFSSGVGPDRRESSRNIASVGAAGLGLPDRDYYTRADSGSAALRAAYVEHVARMLTLAGTPEAKAREDAQKVLRLETQLAEAQLTVVERRDPNATYNPATVAELKAMAPQVDWAAYYAENGAAALASPETRVNVSQPRAVRAMGERFGSVPLEDWKAYLRFNLASSFAQTLSTPFFAESFSFNRRFSGAAQPLPRWQRCAGATDGALGEALGQAYVASEFPPEARARVQDMVRNIRLAFRDRILASAWMSPETKAEALRKLDAIMPQVGYPDVWRDYAALQVSADAPYALNVLRSREFDARRAVSRIGQAVDRGEWQMTPPTVNAYYSSTLNKIVFPAGILRPPFFDPGADDAVNYGAIGMVIGHELTHGFDDQGRKSDAVGNLRDWWTAEDGRRFEERAQLVVDQFNGYVAVDTLHVNGRLTLGENIADLGGLTIAYYAHQKSLEGTPRRTIDGFTPEQRFFMGAAQAWRQMIRPEALRARTLTDPHSPAVWRVNGPLANMPEFAKAFGCKAGDPMVRPEDKRPVIW